MTQNTSLEQKEIASQLVLSKLFITKYSEMFYNQLNNISSNTKLVIHNNKELDQLYDLFLDFIIDSRQYLDYNKNYESSNRV